MKITQINLNGLDLISADYSFATKGLFDFEKDIVTNDLITDGQAFGRSKNKMKSPILNGIVRTFDVNKLVALNAVISPNGLKPLIVTEDVLGKLVGYVEVANRGTNSNVSRAISCQLTMPDPYLYALTPKSVQLGARYSTGVLFGPGTGVMFGPDIGVIFGAATGAGGTLTNDGNADAYPVITIVGACSGIIVTNKTTGESINADTNVCFYG